MNFDPALQNWCRHAVTGNKWLDNLLMMTRRWKYFTYFYSEYFPKCRIYSGTCVAVWLVYMHKWEGEYDMYVGEHTKEWKYIEGYKMHQNGPVT